MPVKEKSAKVTPHDSKETTRSKNKLGKFWIFTISYAAVIVVLNAAAYFSRAFSDFFVNNLFWLAAATTGRISAIFPFSLGELLITLGIVLVIAAIVVLLLMIFLKKKKRFLKAARTYLKTVLTISLTVALLYTFNCGFLYCSTPLSFAGGIGEFDREDFRNVRNYVVEQCNELAPQMERTDNYTMIFPSDPDKAAADALRGVSDEFPRLSGYYPRAKEMWGSYYMYKSGTIGVYFPFSMEANYSKYVSDSYMPHVLAHEYAHLKGYIYESEANFMSFIACVNSGDLAVRYSGYLCVLSYIDSDYKNAVPESEYNEQVQISELVRYDNSCYDYDTWQYLKKRDEEKPQPKAAEIAESVSDKMTDAYMDAFDYEPNYSEVTLLMMQYYTEFGSFAASRR